MTPSVQLTEQDRRYLQSIDDAFRPAVDQAIYLGTLRTAEWYQRQNDRLHRDVRRIRRAFIRATAIAAVMTAVAITFALAWWFA